MHTNLQQKGISKLLGLDYMILYKKGIDNKVADALSRRSIQRKDDQQLLGLHSVVVLTWMQYLAISYDGNPKSEELIQQLSVDPAAVKDYQFKNEILFYKGRMLVGTSTKLRQNLLDSYHNSPIGGHFGIHATYLKLKRYFY